MFKDSAGKVQEYATNAYKMAGMTANEYMSTVTSFSASLIQSLSKTTEQAEGAVTEATINSLQDQLEATKNAQDKNVEAVQAANEKKIDLLEEHNEKELADFEKLTDEKIKLIDKQYSENMKLVDEEEYRRLQAVQAQIDAINAEQEADDAAAKQREENEKKAALQEKINAAETSEEKKKAQEDYDKYIEKLEQERVEASRKARIDELKAQKDVIKEESDEKREALKEQRDAEVKVIQESAKIELEERKKAQKKQLEALKDSQKAELDALKDNNKAKLQAMKDYIAEQKKLVTDGTVEVSNATAETYAAAADIADMAIRDMSDNANKMGSDMAMIQNAYNGFAKKNYTMLDNLKLGYGGTKTEMERLLADAEAISGIEYDIESYSDIIEAIHVIQTEMGITGTTAKEAGTTISGALSSAKSAWSNLVTGITDPNADISQLIDNFVTTITGDGTDNNLGVFGTLIPAVERALLGVGEMIEKLLPKAMELIPPLIKNTLPKLVTAAASIVTAIGQGILDNIESISTYAFDLVMGIVNYAIEAAPNLLQAAITIINTLAQGLADNTNELITSVVDMIIKMVEVLTDPENLSNFINAAFTIISELAIGLLEAIPKLIETVPVIIDNLIDTFLEKNMLEKIIDTGVTLIGALFENLPAILAAIGKSVVKIITGIVDDFKNYDWAGLGQTIVDSILEGFEALGEAGDKLLELMGLSDGFAKRSEDYRDGTGRGGRRDVMPELPERYDISGELRGNVVINQYNYANGDLDANEQRKNNEQLSAAFAGVVG